MDSAMLGLPSDVVLRPLFRLADRRYTVYFDLVDEAALARRQGRAGDEAQAAAALDARTVDRVVPGEAKDEAAHALEQKNSEGGRYEGRRDRMAYWGGGEFSYELKLPAAGSAAVGFAAWGGETRRHTFEVVVDGTVIGTQNLLDDDPGRVLRVEMPIPADLTRGRERVRVGFRPAGKEGSIGAIFDVRILTPGAR